ncbi:hypothetical protein BDW02DRAFT_266955 [Decorospora gaudefroyi]|uniref:Uncharacterized protein n=1 Tax=Decorospora gaudefroyi TaxID=184978 RepID=A0A6A5KK65_9PLEO|nr:hypothetical protein BDW02DRAFT_266955 [Decorospora gaudefroyi]
MLWMAASMRSLRFAKLGQGGAGDTLFDIHGGDGSPWHGGSAGAWAAILQGIIAFAVVVSRATGRHPHDDTIAVSSNGISAQCQQQHHGVFVPAGTKRSHMPPRGSTAAKCRRSSPLSPSWPWRAVTAPQSIGPPVRLKSWITKGPGLGGRANFQQRVSAPVARVFHAPGRPAVAASAACFSLLPNHQTNVEPSRPHGNVSSTRAQQGLAASGVVAGSGVGEFRGAYPGPQTRSVLSSLQRCKFPHQPAGIARVLSISPWTTSSASLVDPANRDAAIHTNGLTQSALNSQLCDACFALAAPRILSLPSRYSGPSDISDAPAGKPHWLLPRTCRHPLNTTGSMQTLNCTEAALECH